MVLPSNFRKWLPNFARTSRTRETSTNSNSLEHDVYCGSLTQGQAIAHVIGRSVHLGIGDVGDVVCGRSLQQNVCVHHSELCKQIFYLDVKCKSGATRIETLSLPEKPEEGTVKNVHSPQRVSSRVSSLSLTQVFFTFSCEEQNGALVLTSSVYISTIFARCQTR